MCPPFLKKEGYDRRPSPWKLPRHQKDHDIKTLSAGKGGFKISSRGWNRYLQGVAKKLCATPLCRKKRFFAFLHNIANLRPLF